MKEYKCAREMFVTHNKKDINLDYKIQKNKLADGTFGRIYLGEKKYPKSNVRAIKVLDNKSIFADTYLQSEIDIMLSCVNI